MDQIMSQKFQIYSLSSNSFIIVNLLEFFSGDEEQAREQHVENYIKIDAPEAC